MIKAIKSCLILNITYILLGQWAAVSIQSSFITTPSQNHSIGLSEFGFDPRRAYEKTSFRIYFFCFQVRFKED